MQNIRNVAIIAHVSHSKQLVDKMLHRTLQVSGKINKQEIDSR